MHIAHRHSADNNEPGDSKFFFRASAWYHVGYEKGTVTFAWLGMRYLNEVKARQCQLPYENVYYPRTHINDFSETSLDMDIDERPARSKTRKPKPHSRARWSSSSRSPSGSRTSSASRTRMRSEASSGAKQSQTQTQSGSEYMLMFTMMVVGIIVTKLSR